MLSGTQTISYVTQRPTEMQIVIQYCTIHVCYQSELNFKTEHPDSAYLHSLYQINRKFIISAKIVTEYRIVI